LGNGTLDDCKTTGQGFGSAEGLAFDDDFAYVAGGAGTVRLCRWAWHGTKTRMNGAPARAAEKPNPGAPS